MPSIGLVSCDIIGHSAISDPSVQRRHVTMINAIVRETLEANEPGSVIWASGGDGGHTLFRQDAWAEAAARYLNRLRLWSLSEGVRLRIVGHSGEVDQIEGADGRVQPYGDGINLAGQLLEFGFSEGVLVTAPFKAALDQAGLPGLLMHDPRILRPQHFPPQLVYLLSAPGQYNSRWDRPAGGDRDLLQQALAEGRAWEALRLVKRLLQVNSVDDQAEEAMDELRPHLLVYRQLSTDTDGRTRERWVPNALLSEVDARTRRHIIRSAQLVERRRGEILCRTGEPGDTLFIVLDGSIGVFPPDAEKGEERPEPLFVAGPGVMVGELAFSMHRPRTADLMAIEDSVMLSVHAAALKDYSRNSPTLAADLERFLTGRTLEYVCNSVDYLIGRDRGGPLAEIGRKKSWDHLLPSTGLIRCLLADSQPVTLQDPRFAGDGLFFLVSGRLRSLAHPEKILSGTELPLAYVHLPGRVVCPDHRYRPEGSDAILLRIGTEAFLGRRPVIDDVLPRLMRALPRLYHFDVFLSYTMDDRVQAASWSDALVASGLRVKMEVSTSGHYFRAGIEAAILDSLTLVALVSANTMSRPLEHNWVRMEIAFRQAAFETNSAQIFPVRLKGGRPELLADGYTIIESIDREHIAMAEVIDAVRMIRQSQKPPPYSLSRKDPVLL